MMTIKVLTFAVAFFQLANFGSTQCIDNNWQDVNGQCMRCGSSFSGSANTGYADAQAVCINNGGNLATILNREQENVALACGTDSWFGYQSSPFPRFLDGTSFVNFSSIDDSTVGSTRCFQLNALADWDEDNACTASSSFVCSRPYDSCLDLEVQGTSAVSYAHADTSSPPTGKRWVGTVATYSCGDGYSLSGAATRTYGSDGSWDGTGPECVATGVCSALTAASQSTITFTNSPASNGNYVVGTVATQVCSDGYKKDAGTDTRACLSSGSWTGSQIECEEDSNDSLTIGLGVGLGVPAALAIAGLLIWLICRPTPPSMGPRPMAPPPPPMGYPRPPPAVRPPYPGRMGLRGLY